MYVLQILIRRVYSQHVFMYKNGCIIFCEIKNSYQFKHRSLSAVIIKRH